MAIVIDYTVLPDGSTVPGKIYRAIVRNHAKLVYEEVGDWLEGTGPIPQTVRETPGIERQILLQHEAAMRMRRRGPRRALALETIEAEPVVEGNRVIELAVQEQNLARCLIEEFMVAANGTLTAFLAAARLPMIHRVVRTPKNWEGIVREAAKRDEILPKKPDAEALTRFLIRQKEADPDRFPTSPHGGETDGCGETAFRPG